MNGVGSVKELHGTKFGIYEYHPMPNATNVYKHIEQEYYLHVNANGHWTVSHTQELQFILSTYHFVSDIRKIVHF